MQRADEDNFVGDSAAMNATKDAAMNPAKNASTVLIPLIDSPSINDPQSTQEPLKGQTPDLQARAELISSIDLTTNVETREDVPFSILETDRTLVKRALITSGYYLKQASGMAAVCWKIVYNYTSLSFIYTAPITAASSYAEMIIEGDKTNFPDITLHNIFDLFAANPDRVKFASYYLRERAFSFVGQGFNGVSMGYLGYAVIKDFAYGNWMGNPLNAQQTLSQYKEEKGKTRLDILISLREHITLTEWLNQRFVRKNPMILRKLADPYKDIYGHTCQLYELAADPQGFILEVMRVPQKEYEQLVALWQERWSLNHKRLAPES